MSKKNKFFKNAIIVTFILCIYLILTTLLVIVEKDIPDASLKNFGDSVWYSYVTLTTLGYGDVLPVTWAGKFIGAIFVLSSVFVLSYVVGQINDYYFTLRERKKMGYNGTDFKNHIVVIGWNEFSDLITTELVKSGKKVAIITNQKNSIDIIYEVYGKENIFVLFANYNSYDLFKKANIEKSNLVFVNLDTDTEKLVFILNMKLYHNNLNYLVSLDDSNLKETFLSAGVTYVLSKNDIASKLIASYIFEPDVANYTADLLESAKEDSDTDFDIQEFLINQNNKYVNNKYGDVFLDIKKEFGSVIIGISKIDSFGNRLLFKLPPDDLIIEEGDYLIMIINGSASDKIQQKFQVKQGVV
jgi:voltage-gated potassium channel